MSRINPRLFYWIAAVHKHPKLSPAHRDILTYLAVMKLDYGTGRGYCSARTLAEGRGWDERTVRRALELARVKEPQLLNRTRRGHRLGDGQVIASEWALIYPPMPVDNGFSTGHAVPVEEMSTGQRSDLNRTLLTSQPVTGAHPTGIESSSGSEASSGSEGHRSAITRLRKIDPEITSEEALAVVDELAARPAVRDPLKVLGAEIASGNGWALIQQARHRTRKADMAQLDGNRDGSDPVALADRIGAMKAQWAADGHGITNSADEHRYAELLGWLDGELLGMALGNAAYLRDMADFMDIVAGLQTRILHNGMHDGEHAGQPGDEGETQ